MKLITTFCFGDERVLYRLIYLFRILYFNEFLMNLSNTGYALPRIVTLLRPTSNMPRYNKGYSLCEGAWDDCGFLENRKQRNNQGRKTGKLSKNNKK